MTDFTSILKALEDGKHHSFDELARCAGMDAAAVADAVARFQRDGVRIEVSQGGAVWPEVIPVLCPARIQQGLDSQARHRLQTLEVFYSLDSTSSHLARQPAPAGVGVCLAETQTSGRGRRGNQWVSPPCSNIYLSLRRRFQCEPARLAGLSLAVGIAVAKRLAPLLRAKVGLKWPNDLYIAGEKLGGILVELVSTSARHADAVIGIGLNISMPDEDRPIDHPWTSLDRHLASATPVDRNRLVADLLNTLMVLLADFPSQGDTYILSQWSDYDVAFGEPVLIRSGAETVRGTGAGIDAAFRFLLRNGDNTRCFHSGEVSLRLR